MGENTSTQVIFFSTNRADASGWLFCLLEFESQSRSGAAMNGAWFTTLLAANYRQRTPRSVNRTLALDPRVRNSNLKIES